MKLNKTQIAKTLEVEYVNGDATLKEIAERENCTRERLCQIGKELVSGWAEAAKRRMKGRKFTSLHQSEESLN